MRLQITNVSRVLGMLSAASLIHTTAVADDQTTQTATTNAASFVTPDTRYGPFNGLDHRSFYSQGNYPEPFLVDDTGLENNEARLDWRHKQAGDSKSDVVKAEYEKSFGLATVEIEVPYERDVNAGAVTQGIGNISGGVRCPFYQYVSTSGFFDTTFGGAFEFGIPASSAISVNPEFAPKIFNDTKIGDHFTMQSVYGYSTFGGGGSQGGLQTFEYAYVFAWTIQHNELPLPGVRQFIPICELHGETQLNKENAGQNTLLGDVGFRLNLKAIGRVQPRPGFAFVFPLDNAGCNDAHWGFVASLVFEF